MNSIRIKAADQIANWTTPVGGYKRIAMHLPGLPNIPTPIPGITSFLCEQGFAVLQPHYSGTYDSGGVFDPYLGCKTAEFWNEQISSGVLFDIASKSNISVNMGLELLSCHSYGTYVGMTALRHGLNVPKCAFFCTSFIYGKDGKAFGQVGDKTHHSRYVSEAYKHTFRTKSKDDIEEFFVTHGRGDLLVEASNCTTSCFVISPGSDPTSNAEISQKGALDFIRSHTDRFSVGGNGIAKDAGHAVGSMLTPEIMRNLSQWFNSET